MNNDIDSKLRQLEGDDAFNDAMAMMLTSLRPHMSGGIPEAEVGSDARADRRGQDNSGRIAGPAQEAWYLAGQCVMELMAIHALAVAEKSHVKARMTMLRSVIEMAGKSIWLVLPDDTRERRRRYLRSEWDNLRNAENAFREHLPARRRIDNSVVNLRRRDMLSKGNRLGLTEKSMTMPPITAVLKEVCASGLLSPEVYGVSNPALFYWRLTSGILHGWDWPMTFLIIDSEWPNLEQEALEIMSIWTVAFSMTQSAFCLSELRLRKRSKQSTIDAVHSQIEESKGVMLKIMQNYLLGAADPFQ